VNSKKAERDRLHRIASHEARQMSCLICGRSPCEPCHWPRHRGLGSAHAGWSRSEWVGLCRRCHDTVDGRLGVSGPIEARRQQAITILEERRKK
jgi:hypothetical protein